MNEIRPDTSVAIGPARRLRPARRAAVTIAAVTSVVTVIAGCSSTSSGSSGSGSGKTYNVLASLPLSGPEATNGEDIQIGLKAAVAQVNSTGGIDGKQVKLTIKNDNGDPNTAVNIVQSAISSGSKPDLVASGPTQEAVAIAPLLQKQKILMINVGAASQLADTSKFPLFFATAIDAFDIQAANIAYAKSKGYTHIALLSGTDGFGQSSEQAFKQAAASAGVKVSYGNFDPAGTDYTAVLEKLRSSNPQAVVFDAIGTPTGLILKDRAAIHWTVPFIGDAGVAVSDNYSFVPHNALKGVVIQYPTLDVAGASGKSPAYKKAYAAFTAGGTLKDPLAATGYGYDVIIAAQVGAASAKSTDGTKIANALETLPASTPVTWVSKNGPLGFTKSSHSVHYVRSDFSYLPIGPISNGLVTAAS